MINTIEDLRIKYAKWALVYFSFVVFLRFLGGKYMYNFVGQPVVSPDFDYLFWLILATKLPQTLIASPLLSGIMDGLIILLPILCLIFIKNRALIGVTLFIFFIHTITTEMYSVSHSKTVVCIFLVLIPAVFSNKTFLLLADFGRYFGASILVSAAYWKYHNGALFTKYNYVSELINQYTDFGILYPSKYLYKISLFLVNHPPLADFLFKILFITQALFILTFITRKFDKLLIIPLVGFSITTWIFMGIYNMDITILFVPFWFSMTINQAYSLKAQ